jgi:hypothetical protein
MVRRAGSGIRRDIPRSSTARSSTKGYAMAYERPTLTKVGDFQKVTGLAGTGSPDLLGGHNLL